MSIKQLFHGVVCPGAKYMYIAIFSIILSKTSWTIKAEFCVEPAWGVGKKVYINGTGHMTRIAAMLIYAKNLQKSFPTELIVLWSVIFGMEHYVLKPIKLI